MDSLAAAERPLVYERLVRGSALTGRATLSVEERWS
jgi:hypothetical protein